MKIYNKYGQFVPRKVRLAKQQKAQAVIELLVMLPVILITLLVLWFIAVLVLA